MTEAFVFDAIRTPRGKGKKDGSLYEVKPVNLLAGVLSELQRRNQLDTSRVDDVVMGGASQSTLAVRQGAGEAGRAAGGCGGRVTEANNGGFASVSVFWA